MMLQELSVSDDTIRSITLESSITILEASFSLIFMFIVQASLMAIVNGTATLKNVNNSLNTNIYSYLETSGACVIKLITAVIYLDMTVKP
jgi:uncharacterized protein YuzB (UPF0349 family)